MLKGKQLILAINKYATEDRALSWKLTLVTLFSLVICLFGVYSVNLILVQFLLSFISGLLIVRMFVIYHDYLHGAIFNNSVIAEWLFTFFGIYVLAPVTVWKRSHSYHHSHNSKIFKLSIGSYPICTKKEFESFSKKEKLIYALSRHPISIVFGYVYIFMYGMCLQPLLASFNKHWDSFLALIVHFFILTISFVYLDWDTAFFLCVFPQFIAGALGALLFYVQHNFPGVYIAEQSEWNYELASLRSSSYFKMGRLMNWFTANIGYHHIHHLNARIPFYKLPEVMNRFPELNNSKVIRIRDISKCFKLKVWDSEIKEMVPFNIE